MRWLGWVRLFRPTALWQWLCAVFAVLVTFMIMSFLMTGGSDLQQLRSAGQDATVRIIQVLDKDANGVPTKVVVEGGTETQPIILDQLDGSLVGNEVKVREIPGEVVWSQTKYHHESLLKGALVSFFLPLGLGFLPIFVANLREERRPTTDLYWGARQPEGGGASGPPPAVDPTQA
jgi:hypothetical protein